MQLFGNSRPYSYSKLLSGTLKCCILTNEDSEVSNVIDQGKVMKALLSINLECLALYFQCLNHLCGVGYGYPTSICFLDDLLSN